MQKVDDTLSDAQGGYAAETLRIVALHSQKLQQATTRNYQKYRSKTSKISGESEENIGRKEEKPQHKSRGWGARKSSARATSVQKDAQAVERP